jgi:hypothetical protein
MYADSMPTLKIGNLDESFAFAGSNAWRCNEIVPVGLLVNKLVEEYITEQSEEPVPAEVVEQGF